MPKLADHLHVRLPADLHRQVRSLVGEYDCTASDVVRMCLQRSLSSVTRTLRTRHERTHPPDPTDDS